MGIDSTQFQKYIGANLETINKDLHKMAYKITREEIKPPNSRSGKGSKRILNIKKTEDNLIEIKWCYERYE